MYHFVWADLRENRDTKLMYLGIELGKTFDPNLQLMLLFV